MKTSEKFFNKITKKGEVFSVSIADVKIYGKIIELEKELYYTDDYKNYH